MSTLHLTEDEPAHDKDDGGQPEGAHVKSISMVDREVDDEQEATEDQLKMIKEAEDKLRELEKTLEASKAKKAALLKQLEGSDRIQAEAAYWFEQRPIEVEAILKLMEIYDAIPNKAELETQLDCIMNIYKLGRIYEAQVEATMQESEKAFEKAKETADERKP